MHELDAIGFGALNIDHLFQVTGVLTDDEAAIIEQQRLPGGSAANTIYGLAKLGLRAGFIGAVGDDEDGKILLNSFKEVGVDISQIKAKKGAKTGSVLALIDKKGGRALYVEPGANSLLAWEDLNIDYARRAKLLHLSSFVDDRQLELQKALVTQLHPTAKVSFSPGAIYARKGLEALMPIIDEAYIIFVNRKELKLLTGKGIEEGAKELRRHGCRIVAVTLGEEGSYVAAEECDPWIEVVTAKQVVDTTGAGDAFATGFLYGLLNGRSLKECAHLGGIVASFCVSQIGARSGLPDRGELQQALQAR